MVFSCQCPVVLSVWRNWNGYLSGGIWFRFCNSHFFFNLKSSWLYWHDQEKFKLISIVHHLRLFSFWGRSAGIFFVRWTILDLFENWCACILRMLSSLLWRMCVSSSREDKTGIWLPCYLWICWMYDLVWCGVCTPIKRKLFQMQSEPPLKIQRTLNIIIIIIINYYFVYCVCIYVCVCVYM